MQAQALDTRPRVAAPQDQIRDYLRATSTGPIAQRRQRAFRDLNDMTYGSLAELLLEHGKSYPPGRLPRGYQPGFPKTCFENTFHVVKRSKGRLRYCEGYATTGLLPVIHAWAWDPEAQHIVDRTWPIDTSPSWDGRSSAYLGLEVPIQVVEYVYQRTGSYCTLDAWQLCYPLLKHPWLVTQANWVACYGWEI